MPELVSINGIHTAIEAAVTSIDDRGYQFGDAVYEYIAAYNGRLYCLDEHLARLDSSMRGLAFPALNQAQLRAELLNLYAASKLPRAGIYIQVSRGVAPRNHAWSEGLNPQVVMTVRQIREVPEEIRQNGATVITVPDLRWGRCDLKTTQLLANAMAKTQALAQGAYDAVFIGPGDVVREATSSNTFIVAAGTLLTHPLTPNILPGITRMVVIRQARAMGLTVEEVFFDKTALFAAEEVFLTGTVTEVLPVTVIDGRPVNREPGAISRKLQAALRREMGA